MAVISLIVAVASVAIPYMQQGRALKQQQKQFDELQQEALSVKLDPHVSGMVRITGKDLGPLGNFVQIPWELTISNTGSRQVSIADYDLTRGDSSGAMSYSGINGGLLTVDYNPVRYPVTLEPGGMRKFFLIVGITVPDRVLETLKGLNEGKDIDRERATTALAKEGLDLYGNRIDYREFEGGGYIRSIDTQNQNGQRFWCVVHTGRGNSFVVAASEYERPGKVLPNQGLQRTGQGHWR
jgi:hypothetical protein